MTDPMTVNSRNRREKVLVAITAAVIIGAAMFTVIIKPQLEERQLRLQRLHQLQLKLTKMTADLLMKDRIDSIYSQIEPLIVGTGTDLQEKSKFARELHELFSKPNVQTRVVTPLPIKKEEFYRRLAVKIEMTGNIQGILNFISAVETYPNPIRIEQLDLKTRDAVDDVQASFTITKVVAKAEGASQVNDEETVE
jgi:Tfp pilus assembly protein PilO